MPFERLLEWTEQHGSTRRCSCQEIGFAKNPEIDYVYSAGIQRARITYPLKLHAPIFMNDAA